MNMDFDEIKNIVSSNDVVLFVKGTKDVPMCGFSKTVIDIFKVLKVSFCCFNVLDDINMRTLIKEYSDWPTIPQIYIKGEFVGGCDILIEMYETKQLTILLDEKNVKYPVA